MFSTRKKKKKEKGCSFAAESATHQVGGNQGRDSKGKADTADGHWSEH